MYKRAGDFPLYFPENNQGKRSFGFFLTGDNFPEEISLPDTWYNQNYIGLYFFLGTDVTENEIGDLSQKLSEYITRNPIERSSCLWTKDFKTLTETQLVSQKDRYSFCIYETCTCKLNAVDPCFETAPEPPVLISVTKDPASGKTFIAQATDALIGNYGVRIIKDTEINFQDEKLNFSCPPFSAAGVFIPLSGDVAGTFQGEACIHDFTPYEKTGMNIGLRFNMYTATNLMSQYYPVFAMSNGQQQVFLMQWDILRPTDSERTWLKFIDLSFKIVASSDNPPVYSIQDDSRSGILLSYFKTIYGKSVNLKITASSKLVFQEFMNVNTQELDYYLAPAGDFELLAPHENSEKNKLLCGLSGTECIEFNKGNSSQGNDLISFQSNHAAYTQAYPVEDSSPGAELLETRCTTSWVMIKPADENFPPVYFSAPESANLFKPESELVLGSFFAPAAKFTQKVIDTKDYYFPLVPYSGISKSWPMDFDPADIAPFERQIINYVRRKIIAGIPIELQSGLHDPESLTDEETISVTPQGLLATTNGLNWKEVLLATCSDAKKVSFSTSPGDAGIPAVLRNAFQSNEMFVVISNDNSTNEAGTNGSLGVFNNALTIENWQFNLNIPKQNAEGDFDLKNILILKFRKGTLIDLVNDSNYWTEPGAFNLTVQLDKSKVQNSISSYFNQAIYMAELDSAFENFVSIIKNPDWFGVIALNADIDLGNLPNDLKGLLGAMKIEQFRAHHVGIEVSYITSSQTEGVKTEKTKLFGMVNYIDEDYAATTSTKDFSAIRKERVYTNTIPGTEAVYAYKVLKLQVSFFNSAVSNFDSLLQFTARKWFADAASLNKPTTDNKDKLAPNYAMQLRGHYENHDGHPTYTFVTEKEMEYKYYVDSRVINCIDFVKAQFSTSMPDTDPLNRARIEHVTGLFSLTGYLNFNKLSFGEKTLDLFSYGAEQGASAGLYFSKLAVAIAFDLNKTDNTVTNLNLTFDPTQTLFDTSLSSLRNGSLGKCFPLSPKSFMAGDKQHAPKTIGYHSIRLPRDYSAGALGNDWFALNLDFHWGGPGALADSVGFVPSLLLGWTAGTPLAFEMFIQLPGGVDALKEIGLQGVLSLKIKNFELIKTDTGYNLMLNGIQLGVLSFGLPPMGSINMALLGNENTSMGWYGMYKK